MARTSFILAPTSCLSSAVAAQTWRHHSSGFCSAHPGWGEDISISVCGEVAEATTAPVSAASRVALMDDDPTSYPRSSPDVLMSTDSTPEDPGWGSRSNEDRLN